MCLPLYRPYTSYFLWTKAVKWTEHAYITIDKQVKMILNRALKMHHFRAQLMKLPDELLLIILKKKVDHTDGLYSLLGLSIRLDQIIRDPCFTTEINLIKLKDDETSGQVETWIDRFCFDILPTMVIGSNG